MVAFTLELIGQNSANLIEFAAIAEVCAVMYVDFLLSSAPAFVRMLLESIGKWNQNAKAKAAAHNKNLQGQYRHSVKRLSKASTLNCLKPLFRQPS